MKLFIICLSCEKITKIYGVKNIKKNVNLNDYQFSDVIFIKKRDTRPKSLSTLWNQ